MLQFQQTSCTELKSYLGLLTYHGKFLPNLATRLAPLYKLLGKKTTWRWRAEQDKAFQESKRLLTSSPLLVHFDSRLPLVLACDASVYGIGAVLAHQLPDGAEKPIGYASSMLNPAERAVQIVKKGLKIRKGSVNKRLAQILMSYRLTPQSTTGVSPAELLLGKQPRSRLDLLKPNLASRVESNQLKQKKQHDRKAKERSLDIGDGVFVRNYHGGNRWIATRSDPEENWSSFIVSETVRWSRMLLPSRSGAKTFCCS